MDLFLGELRFRRHGRGKVQLTSSRASSGTGGMDSECHGTMVPAGGAGPGSASLGAAEEEEEEEEGE